MPTDTSPFEAECRAAIDEVRAALRELYSSVGANIEAPQEVSRRFGVNKTLAWNVSRILTASDPLTSVPSLPGSSAFSILLDSIAKKGAEASTLKRARDAVKLLDQTVSRHVGDRATLELIIDGLTPERGDHLAVSRKLAYRGNSGLLGIQAKARLMTVFMAPNAERPDQIDFAVIRGLIGLRRLRSSVQWPIFQLRAWGHGQAVSSQGNWHSLDVTGPGGASSPLMHNFSNIADSDVQIRHLASGTNVLLAPGPVGNTAAVDCFVGDCVRSGASKYRSELDSTGEFGATISTPTERLLFDFVAHESLGFVLEPEVRAFLGIFHDPSEDPVPEDLLPITVPQSVEPLPGKPPALATPSVPQYNEIMRFVGERMGWSFDRFRACRLDLSHPPFGSTILMRFKLPEAPSR